MKRKTIIAAVCTAIAAAVMLIILVLLGFGYVSNPKHIINAVNKSEYVYITVNNQKYEVNFEEAQELKNIFNNIERYSILPFNNAPVLAFFKSRSVTFEGSKTVTVYPAYDGGEYVKINGFNYKLSTKDNNAFYEITEKYGLEPFGDMVPSIPEYN